MHFAVLLTFLFHIPRNFEGAVEGRASKCSGTFCISWSCTNWSHLSIYNLPQQNGYPRLAGYNYVVLAQGIYQSHILAVHSHTRMLFFLTFCTVMATLFSYAKNAKSLCHLKVCSRAWSMAREGSRESGIPILLHPLHPPLPHSPFPVSNLY